MRRYGRCRRSHCEALPPTSCPSLRSSECSAKSRTWSASRCRSAATRRSSTSLQASAQSTTSWLASPDCVRCPAGEPAPMLIEWIGLLGSLALLIVLTMRGVDLLLAAPLCALVLAFSFGLPVFPATAAADAANFTSAYMTGFSGFLASWFFVFLLGSIFGKVMEDSGAADSVAQWVVARFGARHALLAVIGACAVLTYGGVSLFVVAFSVFPLALALFREAGLPRRFIPGAIGFGSVTFTMTSAGSPEIQNWIPMQYLGTTPYAAW